MKAKIVLIAFVLLIGTACAELQTKVQNNPLAESPNGNLVYVGAFWKTVRQEMTSPLGGVLKKAAYDWLQKHGYEITTIKREADYFIGITAHEDNKTLCVPGESYTTPVYGTQGFTATTVGSSGYSTTQVEGDTTNYVQNYVGPHNVEVNFQGISLSIILLRYNHQPMAVSEGWASYNQYNQDLIGDARSLNSGITDMLD